MLVLMIGIISKANADRPYTYTTIDYHGASRTYVYAINGSNKIEE
jgi:hypothetical protein